MQPCYWAIAKIPGLSTKEQELLSQNGIKTTRDLLLNSQTPQARNLLANKLQLHIKHINKWIALADLARIPSVGYQYCGLLLHSGIASTMQLSQTPLHRIHPTIKRLYVATMQRQDLTPSVSQVKKWIEEARLLMMNRELISINR
ncbi:conserved hypothetical protein [Hyella patelloides LEGE 07179]|uniref:DUF4332 domain-containing protein n=1 Tax=Hyella patelloides LEGE 07179 TaxID=945734 RepID=A0A563VZ48_9CYAN|nr:DUF4332 domain-containing protein [Hyella patelloides]VEP16675.1 conserved hypothetical protein [Hyella patelloides LEGE 07179]